jgi:protein FRG1
LASSPPHAKPSPRGILPLHLHPDTPGTFSIQTQHEKFLTITEDSNDNKPLKSAATQNDLLQHDFPHSHAGALQTRLKANKESRAREKISRKELEDVVGGG